MKQTGAVAERAAVHIVDDDASTRRMLWYILESTGFAPRVFAGADDLIDELDHLPDAPLVTDLFMPGTDGQTLLLEVKRRRPLTPVILMTAQADVASAVAAMKAGAFDFIQKPIDHLALIASVRSAVDKLSETAQRNQDAVEASQRLSALSASEREVLTCLAAGKSNKVIAYDLGLSIRTVEMHRVRMMRRLAVRGLPDALRLAHLAHLALSAR